MNDNNINKFVNLIDISKNKYIEETEAKDDHFKKLGLNALEFSKKFDWNKVVKKYIELI